MLVVYMQRAIIVLVVTGIPLTVAYIFCEPILLLLGEPPELASVAAVFVYGLIPQIFGYAVNFPYRSFCRRRVWWCQALTYETDFRIRVECWKRILESINTQNLSMKFWSVLQTYETDLRTRMQKKYVKIRHFWETEYEFRFLQKWNGIWKPFFDLVDHLRKWQTITNSSNSTYYYI